MARFHTLAELTDCAYWQSIPDRGNHFPPGPQPARPRVTSAADSSNPGAEGSARSGRSRRSGPIREVVGSMAGALLKRHRGRQGVGVLIEAARRDVVDR